MPFTINSVAETAKNHQVQSIALGETNPPETGNRQPVVILTLPDSKGIRNLLDQGILGISFQRIPEELSDETEKKSLTLVIPINSFGKRFNKEMAWPIAHLLQRLSEYGLASKEIFSAMKQASSVQLSQAETAMKQTIAVPDDETFESVVSHPAIQHVIDRADQRLLNIEIRDDNEFHRRTGPVRFTITLRGVGPQNKTMLETALCKNFGTGVTKIDDDFPPFGTELEGEDFTIHLEHSGHTAKIEITPSTKFLEEQNLLKTHTIEVPPGEYMPAIAGQAKAVLSRLARTGVIQSKSDLNAMHDVELARIDKRKGVPDIGTVRASLEKTVETSLPPAARGGAELG